MAAPLPSRHTSRFVAGSVSIGIFVVLALVATGLLVSNKAVAPVAKKVNSTVAVTLSDYKISPATITVPAGNITINVTNSASQNHNLEAVDLGAKTDDIPGGGSATLSLPSMEPGTYTLRCNIPGHESLGMKAQLVVTDGGSATSAASGATSGDSMAGMNMSSGSTADGNISAADAAKMDKAMNDSFGVYLKRVLGGQNDKNIGNQKLAHTVGPDGAWQFNVTAKVTDWETAPGHVVKAWTYNGMVPGPWIQVPENTPVEINLTNNTPLSTDIHFHGVDTPFADDGVAPLTQDPIKPGQTYQYKFTTPAFPEVGMWHAHMHGSLTVVNGLFAIFQVGDEPLPKQTTVSGVDTSNIVVSQQIPMVLNDAGNIGLTLNGKAFPETQAIVAKPGEWIEVHYLNEGLQGHPMHLHHFPQIVIAKDGYPLDQPYAADTIWVAPGERYTVLVHATDTGVWAWHCHILTHAESENGMIGMVTALVVLTPDGKVPTPLGKVPGL